jgi:hypothetical protein
MSEIRADFLKAPEILKRSEEYQQMHTMDDAVRSLTYIQNVSVLNPF